MTESPTTPAAPARSRSTSSSSPADTIWSIETGDDIADVLEDRVIRLEEFVAARWPRSWLPAAASGARDPRLGRRVRRQLHPARRLRGAAAAGGQRGGHAPPARAASVGGKSTGGRPTKPRSRTAARTPERGSCRDRRDRRSQPPPPAGCHRPPVSARRPTTARAEARPATAARPVSTDRAATPATPAEAGRPTVPAARPRHLSGRPRRRLRDRAGRPRGSHLSPQVAPAERGGGRDSSGQGAPAAATPGGAGTKPVAPAVGFRALPRPPAGRFRATLGQCRNQPGGAGTDTVVLGRTSRPRRGRAEGAPEPHRAGLAGGGRGWRRAGRAVAGGVRRAPPGGRQAQAEQSGAGRQRRRAGGE